tara:strand:+ start:1151 stop:1654 length:504 start_codon:yes stop_codon:yes gene_type:complete
VLKKQHLLLIFKRLSNTEDDERFQRLLCSSKYAVHSRLSKIHYVRCDKAVREFSFLTVGGKLYTFQRKKALATTPGSASAGSKAASSLELGAYRPPIATAVPVYQNGPPDGYATATPVYGNGYGNGYGQGQPFAEKYALPPEKEEWSFGQIFFTAFFGFALVAFDSM